MDKKFLTIMRTGKTIDIKSEIEDLEATYRGDIEGTLDAYNSYDRISDETFNDFLNLKKTISTFEMLGYLDRDEAAAMIDYAAQIRMDYLDSLIPPEPIGGNSNEY